MDLSEFASPSEQIWLEKIKKELKIDAISEVSSKHGFAINPLLRNNVAKPVYQGSSNNWKFGITLELTDSEVFNTKLKQYLGWGMNAIYVRIPEVNVNLERAFDGIFLEMIYPIFNVADVQTLAMLQTFMKLQKCKNFAVDSANNVLEDIGNQSFTHELISIKIGNKIIQAIGDIRSLKQSPYTPDNHRVTTFIGCTPNSPYHPLIELTCQSVAAVTGGADIVILESQSIADEDKIERLAINIHNILQMESNLHWVDDPTKGSYLIEQLTT